MDANKDGRGGCQGLAFGIGGEIYGKENIFCQTWRK